MSEYLSLYMIVILTTSFYNNVISSIAGEKKTMSWLTYIGKVDWDILNAKISLLRANNTTLRTNNIQHDLDITTPYKVEK